MKIKIWIKLNLQGCRIEDELEIPDEELEGLTDREREQYIDENAKDYLFGFLDYGWSKKE